MAHSAIPELAEPLRTDLVILDELPALSKLVGGRLPLHVEDLLPGPNLFFRCLMAIQAPAHVERMSLPYKGHLINGTVAGRTADTLLNMNAVIKKDEIGQLIDSFPMKRFLTGEALTNWRQHGRIGPHARMAGHAGFGWRDSCKRGFFNRGMAIAAIQSQPCNVVLMTKGHLLLARDVLVGGVRRAIDEVDHTPKGKEAKEAAHQCRSRETVAALSKYLAHEFSDRAPPRTHNSSNCATKNIA